MTVRYEVPDDLEPRLRELVERNLWALPIWVDELVIKWDADNVTDLMSTSAYYEQRLVTVWVHPPSLEDRTQELTLQHEFGHVVLAPLDDALAQTQMHLTGKTLKAAEEAYRRAVEAVVSDLSIIYRRINEAA